MCQLRRRPPSQLSLLFEACRSTCGTACPRKQTSSRLSSQLSYAALSINTPGGPFPRPWTSSSPHMTLLQLQFSLSTLTTHPPGFTPPEDRGTLTPLTLLRSAFARVRRRLSLSSFCAFHFVFLGSFVYVSCPQPLWVILGQPFLLLPTPPD